MKRRTLFTISPHYTDITGLKNSLEEAVRERLNALTAFIRGKIGELDNTNGITAYHYRITNMNYIKLYFSGMKTVENTEEASEFHLTLVIAGYTEFPSLELTHSARLTMSVVDATDAFWLIELLRYGLANTGGVGEQICD
ncbi:hypothetical protein RYD26_05255 [Pasteurellaceae bacterium LIM206]|nr:hypothetical protein [Pasteurellaceae bacterium LIM206]